ncbi:MAG: TdeIII family type II restriction endonuclease [Clostridium sp.]|nr:TdeIII family type II restriction endonuclease [Clostridium sp.]MCM1172976.1 TdeIII family type II restriction endonuclease [Clostridium sp.]MCM1208488.1 TdeIII family type II restriction endonuclease [Ruminococcus sp.]
MTDTEEKIKQIVYEEFSKLIHNIESDFSINYVKKRYNFLLNQLDEMIIANMVFVSSFESKSGYAIETCAKRIARLKFGEQNVPSIVNPRNVKHDINPETVNGQIIVTDIDTDNGALRGTISEFRATNVASGKGSNRLDSGVTQNSIKSLIPLAQKYKTSGYHTKPVDLAFFDGKDWVVLELKAGGDLDSSNAPANVEKLLTIYAGLNVPNAKAYFATLYNKNGEGNTWTGAVKKHMAYPQMFLIGKNFWNTILPEGITYERFTTLYKVALEELDLNYRIKEMINKTVK